MKGKQAAKASAEVPPRVAMAEDISRAIEAIVPHDFVRLAAYSQNRISTIGPLAANGRDSDDLLQEAVIRLADGRRHWYPDNVDIVKYLIRVVESVASEWAAHRKRNSLSPDYAALKSERIKDDEAENPVSQFDAIRTAGLNVEQQAIADDIETERKAVADEIERSCAADNPALMVILDFQSGMKGPAIRKRLGWTETEYRTAVRRIKRRAEKILERRYGR
jgi:DNA-directed RNA polymerase specialized sigma24 family protein